MSEQTFTLDTGHAGSGRPKHEQLRDHLVNEILAGRLKPGAALPSERRLMKTLGIARTTVCQAMAALEDNGIIRRVQGSGTFVETDARRKLNRGLDIFALVVPETQAGFYPSLLHGFETAAADIRHQTLICSTDENVYRQGDIILQLLDKEVGGVAMVPVNQPMTPAHQIRQLRKQGVPVVFCHRGVEGIAAPLLSIPFRELGYRAGRILAARGHRRVAFFTSCWVPVDSAIEEGLNEGFRAGGGDIPVRAIAVGNSLTVEEPAVWASLQEVFKGADQPTAIFAGFDSLAEMIYLLMPRLGLRVPEDVSLLGFGGAFREGALARRLSSVVIDELATGRKAVSLLHEMRRGDRPIDDNQQFALELGFYEGETLAAPAAERPAGL
jgi:GntR family transcriptional regulator, arabinose operon transcriptional repressor